MVVLNHHTKTATILILFIHICCVQILVVVIDGEVGLLNHTLSLVDVLEVDPEVDTPNFNIMKIWIHVCEW